MDFHGSFILATGHRQYLGHGSRLILLRRFVAYGETSTFCHKTGSFDTVQLLRPSGRDTDLFLCAHGGVMAAAYGSIARVSGGANNPGTYLEARRGSFAAPRTMKE